MKRFIGTRKRGVILMFCFYILAVMGLILSVSVLKRDVYMPYVLGIFLLSIVGYSVILLNKQVARKGVRLSTRLTALYDFFIPLTILAALLAVILILVLGLNRPGGCVGLIVGLILGMFMLLFVYLTKLSRLKTIYVNEDEVFVSDFFWERSYKIAEIKKFGRWISTTYRLKVEQDGKCYNYLIMPSVKQEVAAGIGVLEKTEIECFIKEKNIRTYRKYLFRWL